MRIAILSDIHGNADALVAASHWLYMTLRRLGREAEARAVLGDEGVGGDGEACHFVRSSQPKKAPDSLRAARWAFASAARFPCGERSRCEPPPARR